MTSGSGIGVLVSASTKTKSFFTASKNTFLFWIKEKLTLHRVSDSCDGLETCKLILLDILVRKITSFGQYTRQPEVYVVFYNLQLELDKHENISSVRNQWKIQSLWTWYTKSSNNFWDICFFVSIYKWNTWLSSRLN